jgi:hypothetical protein
LHQVLPERQTGGVQVRMTPAQFTQWLAAMEAAGMIGPREPKGDASKLLGVTRNTIGNYCRDGAPLLVAHACSNIWHRLGPWTGE